MTLAGAAQTILVAGLGLITAPSGLATAAGAESAVEQTLRARAGACEREAEKLSGQKPVRIGGSIPAPKQVRQVPFNYPPLPTGTTGTGMWLGEALVSNSGKVTHVWPIREVMFTPAFPAFNNAVADAIRRQEYEPVIVDGKASPFCMTVSLNINWR